MREDLHNSKINPYEREAVLQPEKILQTTNNISEIKLALSLGFSEEDFDYVKSQKLKFSTIQNQLNQFKNGIPPIELVKSARNGDGIHAFTYGNHIELAIYYDNYKDNFKVEKFVPASGAATRMFKFLIEFLCHYKLGEESINAFLNRQSNQELQVFLVGIDKFPFFKEVYDLLVEEIENFTKLPKDQRIYHFISYLISDLKFDFSSKPKAILPFHKYENHVATPIFEHFKEAVNYANSSNEVKIHFTVSEEHLENFKEIVDQILPQFEEKNQVKINVEFSFQDVSTNTIAVTQEDRPLRCTNGKLIFRPGGHGALIQNLNQLDSDIVFIKNIDNVLQNHIEETTLYKKSLAGLLLKLQNKIFEFLKEVESNDYTTESLNSMLEYLESKLHLKTPKEIIELSDSNKANYLFQLLNRPIRVGGMVVNEGEPGGGPFWVSDKNGNISLQIVESSQVDRLNVAQQEIFASSTHFNPVDLVCGIRNYKGEKFDLTKFVDENTGFIVEKSINGIKYKAYELPGLWNGAMSNWITIFVEVPLITFNPVKTVNDLLKSTHQPPNDYR